MPTLLLDDSLFHRSGKSDVFLQSGHNKWVDSQPSRWKSVLHWIRFNDRSVILSVNILFYQFPSAYRRSIEVTAVGEARRDALGLTKYRAPISEGLALRDQTARGEVSESCDLAIYIYNFLRYGYF